MKSNPLFVDSTKFRGDLILSQVEVRTRNEVQGSLKFRIRRESGDDVDIELVKDGTHLWRGQAYLEHQESIEAQIVFCPNDRIELLSQKEKRVANYIIHADWDETPEVSLPVAIENDSLLLLASPVISL